MPDVFEERVFAFAARLEFFRSEGGVVDFTAELAFELADGFRYGCRVGFADDEHIDVAGGVLLVFGEGAVEIGFINFPDVL